jgi:hypothetical protein
MLKATDYSLLFLADEELPSIVHKVELLVKRPSPYSVYVALLEAGVPVTNSRDEMIEYQPYGHNNQVHSSFFFPLLIL